MAKDRRKQKPIFSAIGRIDLDGSPRQAERPEPATETPPRVSLPPQSAAGTAPAPHRPAHREPAAEAPLIPQAEATAPPRMEAAAPPEVGQTPPDLGMAQPPPPPVPEPPVVTPAPAPAAPKVESRPADVQSSPAPAPTRPHRAAGPEPAPTPAPEVQFAAASPPVAPLSEQPSAVQGLAPEISPAPLAGPEAEAPEAVPPERPPAPERPTPPVAEVQVEAFQPAPPPAPEERVAALDAGPAPLAEVEAAGPAPVVPEPAPAIPAPETAPPPLPEEQAAAPAPPPPKPKIPRSIRISAMSLDFARVVLGEGAERELTVFNQGEEELTITGLRGLPAEGFKLLDPPPSPCVIPPLGSLTLKIGFAPTSDGAKRATLAILSDDPDGLTPEVGLRGLAIRAISTPAGVYYSPLVNSLGMSFVYLPAGTFAMGSPGDEPGRNPDEALHEVTLTRAFYLQTTPVTQEQWLAIMEQNPSAFPDGGAHCPVDGVSFADCQEFLKRLNARGEGTYRLPTEAEWEYACRAGSNTAFANGEIVKLFCEPDPNLQKMGWYCGNSERRTRPVAQKDPNAWGLYDMHGNVSEWCQDWYGPYPEGGETDPAGPSSGSGRVVRGGSWFGSAKTCRSAHRFKWPPHSRSNLQVLGLRLVREP